MTRNVATVRLYAAGTGFKKRQIAEDLSVSERIVRSYLTEVDKQLHKEHEQQIFELYMDCWTQQEIAEQIGMAQKSVSRIIKISVKMEVLPISVKVSISIEIQTLSIPPCNIWTFNKLNGEVKHFGNSEQQVVDNLLYLYTEPYNIISLLTRLPVVALPLMFVESDCVDAIFPIENRYPLEKIKYANWVWRSLLTVWLE